MMKAMHPDGMVKQNSCSSSEWEEDGWSDSGLSSQVVPMAVVYRQSLNFHGSWTKQREKMIKAMPLLLQSYFFLFVLLVSCPGRNAQESYIQVIYAQKLFICCSQDQLEKIKSSLKQPCTSSDCFLWAAHKPQFSVEGEEEEEIIRSTCRH